MLGVKRLRDSQLEALKGGEYSAADFEELQNDLAAARENEELVDILERTNSGTERLPLTLVCEDDSMVREVVVQIIRKFVYEGIEDVMVLEFDNAERVEEFLKLEEMRKRVSLLISDNILRGEGDGIGLVKKLRDEVGMSDLPILMMSGSVKSPEQIAQLRGQYLAEFIRKPFRPSDLVGAIDEAVRKVMKRTEA